MESSTMYESLFYLAGKSVDTESQSCISDIYRQLLLKESHSHQTFKIFYYVQNFFKHAHF